MLRRIFLAINLPNKVKTELLRYKERWPALPARWTTPENLHITLMFLGNTSDKELKEIQKNAGGIATRHKAFSFSLSQIVYEPQKKQPRMICAKGTMSKELMSLQKDLARALGYQEEHPFSLHITLARLNEWEFRRIEPEERPIIDEEISLTIPVSSFEIMESTLKRGGAKYSVIESIALSS